MKLINCVHDERNGSTSDMINLFTVERFVIDSTVVILQMNIRVQEYR